jgi:hypothetical protein
MAAQKRVFNLQSVCQMSRLMGKLRAYFQTTLICQLLPIGRNGDQLKGTYSRFHVYEVRPPIDPRRDTALRGPYYFWNTLYVERQR